MQASRSPKALIEVSSPTEAGKSLVMLPPLGRRSRPAGSSAEDARERVLRRRREVAKLEQEEPLYRRILRGLAVGPQTPSGLAGELGVSKEEVSRLLKRLLREDRVEFTGIEGDRRRRLYRLTPEGERAFGRHLAFGAAEPRPHAPGRERLLALAWAGLQNALRMRRQANRLDEAVERMRMVLRQAEDLHEEDLLIDTMAELAATLRQACRYEELDAVMLGFERMACGTHPGGSSALVLPATAHRQYELGRMREGGVIDAGARARHLETAESLYGELGQFAEPHRKPAWVQREGWSVLSLASNLRERSQLEQAVEKASSAMSCFQGIQDDYGLSRSLFVIGLCLRLMGDFPGSWSHLTRALKLAQEHTFERFQTDTLLQMGDVQRCMGHIEPARLLLSEALAQANRMDLLVMQAFAVSSLGACCYQEGELDAARRDLNRAQALFKQCGHREGLALNSRRRAVVKCRLYDMPGASALNALKRAVASARRQYEDLRSPAGAVACEIELGRVLLSLQTKPTELIERLKARLTDPPQRDLIALDPWVPDYLLEFSADAEDRALRSLARSVANDGRRYVWSGRRAKGRATRVEKAVFEMGGESRHVTDAPTASALFSSAASMSGQTPEVDLGRALRGPLFVPADESSLATAL